jgi:hypothetical protein
MNDLKVCWWPIEKIIPYSKNARKIPQKAIDKVAKSLLECFRLDFGIFRRVRFALA